MLFHSQIIQCNAESPKYLMTSKEQVIQEIKRAGLFSIQHDEFTDVQSCSQLLAFVRYVHDEDQKEEFLFCEPLEQSIKGENVMQKLTEFFESEGLDWGNLCGICTDRAPAMLDSQSGFVTSYTKSTKCYSSSLHDPQARSCIKKRYPQNYKTL